MYSKKSMIISGSSFLDNSARISGGAIYSFPACGVGEEQSIVDMSSSVLTNNAASEGGAVYIHATGHLHDRGSIFAVNTANAGRQYTIAYYK